MAMSADQLALTYPPHRMARADDPATSHEAAHGDRTPNRTRILRAYAAFGDLIYTAAAQRAGLEPHEAHRRISELVDKGLLMVASYGGRELIAITPKGRRANVYRITDEGKRALRQQ
jgi:predicted transcriptional regulator